MLPFIIPRDDFLRDEYINTRRKRVGFFSLSVFLFLSFRGLIHHGRLKAWFHGYLYITCSMGEVGNGIGFVIDDDQRVCDALYFCWFFFFLPCFELWKLLWRDGFNYFFFCLFNFSSKNNGLFVLLGTRRKCSIHSDRRNDITIVVIIFIGSLVVIISVLLFL